MSVHGHRLGAAAAALLALGLVGPPTAGATPVEGSAAVAGSGQPSVRLIDLGLRGSGARAERISDRGVVIGSFTAPGSSGAFRWEDGEQVELEGIDGLRVAANDVNNRGQVVGYANLANGDSRAALWQPDGTLVELGSPGQSGHATGINERGVVAGVVFADDGPQAVIWEDGVPTELGDLGGNSTATAQPGPSLNDRGQVTGSGLVADGGIRAFLWDRGTLVPLLAPDGSDDPTTFPRGVNRRGQVVGMGGGLPVVWDADGRATVVPGLGGEVAGTSTMSDRGHIVGSAQTPDGAFHAFLHVDGETVDLGTLGGGNSEANAVNRNGQVVGSADVGSDSFHQRHAVLWDDGRTIDLGALGGGHSQALDINRHGVVVGYSTDEEGVEHAVLWVVR